MKPTEATVRSVSQITMIALLVLTGAVCGTVSADGPSHTGGRTGPYAVWEWFEQPDPFRAERYNALHPQQPFTFKLLYAPPEPPGPDKIVLIIVNTSLRPSIQDELETYEQDLKDKGYDVALVEAEGGTQEDIRELLQSYYASWGASFNGCLLVGELPIPWFQHFNDWYGHEDVFACDLYYADMDGSWDDTDSNGIPDSHTDGSGDTKPEIWIGRVTANDMSEDEVTLVKRFFHNNHQYRLGYRNLPRRALLYQDDDWAHDGGWYSAFGNLLSDRDWISDHDTTNATDYESRFDDEYQWLLVCSHSNAHLHSFKSSSGTTYYYWYQLKDQNPHFHFCITFACSNADYTQSDYMSGWYLFDGDYVQLVLGSTKTGGFWYGGAMFQALNDQKNIGEAYCDWFSSKYPYSDTDIAWWYGLTLLGDPTLYVPSDTYIRLASFTAHARRRSILLCWETGAEIENAGFELFRDRSADGHSAKLITPRPITAKGSPTAGASYRFIDSEVQPGITYYYWLVDIDTAGRWTAHGPVCTALFVAPEQVILPQGQIKHR